MAQVDPRDMLNNFCFHVYAQKSLFIAENCNALSDISSINLGVCRAGSHLNLSSMKLTDHVPGTRNFSVPEVNSSRDHGHG